MARTNVRERVKERRAVPAENTVNLKKRPEFSSPPPPAAVTAPERPKKPVTPVHEGPQHAEKHPHEAETRVRLRQHTPEKRWQEELAEMQQTGDLDEVDDDVERAATLLEWQAPEHVHRPKSPVWFAALAAGTTVVIGVQLFFFVNFVGALTFAFLGGLMYYIAQQKPAMVRYRILVDGIALNSTLYHYDDLEAFNVLYQPGETSAVLLRSNRTFVPLIHMEIGEANPVAIREVLAEFLPEDPELTEPLVDVAARRLGF
jgi:hypothetical protein